MSLDEQLRHWRDLYGDPETNAELDRKRDAELDERREILRWEEERAINEAYLRKGWWAGDGNFGRTWVPPFVPCRFDDPVEVRFPLATDGQHYPVFDLVTQQVVYPFPQSKLELPYFRPGFSEATLTRIHESRAAWKRSDAARRAWVTIRRNRAAKAAAAETAPCGPQ